MKVLFVGRRKPGEKNDVVALARLVKEQAGADAEITQAYFEELVFDISDNTQLTVGSLKALSINHYTVVVMIGWSHSQVYSDVAHAVALYCHAKGVQVWNSELVTARSRTKLSQLMHLSLSGIIVPRTMFALDHDLLQKSWQERGSLPAICKDITASRGRRNFLVRTPEELGRAVRSGNSMLLQELIANDGADVRFLVAGGKPRLAIRRKGAVGSHLTNLSAGGTGELVPLSAFDDSLLAEVTQVANIFKRELCGVDYILDRTRKQYIFLEVNLTPQIVNGAFVADKIAALYQALKENS